jgi:hypothetical protein
LQEGWEPWVGFPFLSTALTPLPPAPAIHRREPAASAHNGSTSAGAIEELAALPERFALPPRNPFLDAETVPVVGALRQARWKPPALLRADARLRLWHLPVTFLPPNVDVRSLACCIVSIAKLRGNRGCAYAILCSCFGQAYWVARPPTDTRAQRLHLC